MTDPEFTRQQELLLKRMKIRKIWQRSFFLILLLIFLALLGGRINHAHPFCPYSAVCLGVPLFRGYLIFPAAVVLGILIALSSIFLGRKFCSYVCFLGTIQEFLYSLRPRKHRFLQILPFRVHTWLKIIKYLILLFTLVSSILLVQYLYMGYCPILALAFPGSLSISAAVILLIILIIHLFIERFWCRYLCPYAALMNIIQFLGKILGIPRKMIYRNVQTSINCFNCQNYCPMQIDIGYNEVISDLNCIQCLRCVRICHKTAKSQSRCLYRDNI